MLNLEATSIPELCVNIEVKRLPDDSIRIIGTPIHTESQTAFTELGTVTGRKTSRKRQQHAINAVIQELEDRYAEVYGIRPLDKNAFMTANDALMKAVTEQGYRLRSSWKSPQTNTNILTYTYKNIFPLIYPYLDPKARLFLESDRQEIEDTLVQNYMDKNGGTIEHARPEIWKRLDQADCVLANLRDFDPRVPLLRLCPSTPY